MTFRYSVTLPVGGNDKLRRFRAWADIHVPTLSYSLLAEMPANNETTTVKLLCPEDRQYLLDAVARSSVI